MEYKKWKMENGNNYIGYPPFFKGLLLCTAGWDAGLVWLFLPVLFVSLYVLHTFGAFISFSRNTDRYLFMTMTMTVDLI